MKTDSGSHGGRTMQRGRSRLLLAIAAVLVGVGALWLSRRDGPERSRAPTHPVQDDVVLDLGPYAELTRRGYQVRSGDTLGHIAQRELGSVRHVQAIRELNPGLSPRSLSIGMTVWLPPHAEGFGAGEHVHEGDALSFYLWRIDEAGTSGELVPTGQEVPVEAVRHGAYVLAVPMGAARAAEQALREASAFGRPLPHLPAVAVSARIDSVRAVPQTHETARVVHRVRVLGIDGERLMTQHHAQRLDDRGREILPLPEAGVDWGWLLMMGATMILVVVAVLLGARRLEGAPDPL